MSNTFENALKSTLNNQVAFTENGAAGFATAGKKLLDINFAVTGLRAKSDVEVAKMFAEAFYEDPKTAVKWLFYARDVRQGMGERRLFRIALSWLVGGRDDIARAIIPAIMEYGRADDMLTLLDTSIGYAVVNYIDSVISKDMFAAENNQKLTLLAKWLPSCNTSSSKTRELATKLRRALNLSEKQYRKMLSTLRAKLNVTEVAASANNWSEIDYNMVPSKANMKYKRAFLKHDKNRRSQWIADLADGANGAKVNVSALTAPDIAHKYVADNDNIYAGYNNSTLDCDDMLEAAWKALPTTFKSTHKVIAVVDGSGSMGAKICSGSNMTCHDVANALGIYFSERLDGPFKNKLITFSKHPQYVDLTNCKTFAEKLMHVARHNEVANTDIEATMNLILNTAICNRLAQEDIPDLCIFSDMQFDVGTTWGTTDNTHAHGYDAKRLALFENIKVKFADAGYQLPKITFWNINSGDGRGNDVIPIQQNDLGVALVSGFSQNTCKMVMSNKLDPYEILLDTINDPRYNLVDECLASVKL